MARNPSSAADRTFGTMSFASSSNTASFFTRPAAGATAARNCQVLLV